MFVNFKFSKQTILSFFISLSMLTACGGGGGSSDNGSSSTNLNPSQELNQESEASISNDVMNNAQESSNEVVDAQIIEDESISQSQNLTKENLEANDKPHEVSFSEGGLSMAPKKS